jgi:hypothetical protein
MAAASERSITDRLGTGLGLLTAAFGAVGSGYVIVRLAGIGTFPASLIGAALTLLGSLVVAYVVWTEKLALLWAITVLAVTFATYGTVTLVADPRGIFTEQVAVVSVFGFLLLLSAVLLSLERADGEARYLVPLD